MISLNSTIFDGLVSFQNSPLTFPATAATALAIICFAYLAVSPQTKPTDVRKLPGLSILTAWPFFTRRHDFLKSNFTKVGEQLFTFKVLQHSITAAKGEDARKDFFDNKSLNFTEGYRILMGAVPRLQDIDIQTESQEDVSWFNKNLLTLLNRSRLSDVLPTLFEDIQGRMDGWGKEGKMDPFKNVYDLVFQMTVRMATCRELSADLETVTRLQGLYWTLEKSATPTSLLLPWLPSPAKKQKEVATQEIYTLLDQFVEKRRAADVPSSDAIDVLLSQGNDNQNIIGFIIGVVFAGVINTGINSCWTLLFLAHNPEWRKKVETEVQSLIMKHTNTTSSEPLHQRLAAIPISVWEDEMPILDVVIRETIRLVVNGAALRRNVHEDLHMAGKTIPKGNFVTYPVFDAHLNSDIYTNPTKFDPDRFSPDREEDKKEKYAYLGWGAGRHPCTGMKVAKLEIKIIVALFVAAYEYDLVDSAGKYPASLPKPNYNDIQQARPVGEPCYLKFKRVVE
ncbi:cytochrome P450 [Collybia nuda]|uniref:Cytochrome P450 n=1 Tax=Collybia nuda TaxID=64659 RepID=A0A9P6CE19_9AGAR|nr:cytochrome P450 [Collybia nuda]